MVNQHARKKGAHEIGDGGPDGQPAKGFLELVRIAGHAAHVALQCNDRNAGGAAVVKAPMQSTGKMGHTTAKPAPAQAMSTLNRTGFFKP